MNRIYFAFAAVLLFTAIVFFSCFGSRQAVIQGKKYTLTPFTKSINYKDATIRYISFDQGKMNFDIAGTSYKLGEQTSDAPLKMCANSAQGQHIHVIVDNKPYDAKYQSAFDYDITDGEHYFLAFLSRSYHESIKTGTAYQVLKVNVKNKSFMSSQYVNSPMLFYSRPKGNYVGEAETKKVMLDFYPVNVTIAKNQYRVKAEINDETFILDHWQPYYIEGLPMGENKIKLTLIDKTGEVVQAPLNPVERVFTLKADPAKG
jgi:hypothetical protein